MAKRSLRRSNHEQRSSERMESATRPGVKRCADHTDERLQKKSLLEGIASQYRRSGIYRFVGISLQLRMFSLMRRLVFVIAITTSLAKKGTQSSSSCRI